MGICFSALASCSEPAASSAHAQVVSINGGIHEYALPVFVSQVLHAESSSSSSSSSSSIPNNWFICDSDLLLYDEYIPAMDSNAQLHFNHLYFVLPISKLNYKLSAPDMAALAVKATVALQKKGGTHRARINISNNNYKKTTRISPLSFDPDHDFNHGSTATTTTKTTTRSSFYINSKTRSQSKTSQEDRPKNTPRAPSRRAKLAVVRSFRLKLATIYEGTVLV